MDTFFAIVRRLINKKPIMEPDKEHLHHQLMKKGLNQKQTVLVLYAISIFLGLTAVFISNANTQIGVLTGIVVALIIFVVANRLNLIKKVNKK